MTAARTLAAAAAVALAALTALAGGAAQAATAEKIGTVDTAFQWIGRDHDIIVEAYDDPGVQGVTCYVSRARIACRQVGPISFPEPLKKQEEVFSERMSILFKRLRIVRMVDPARNTLVYLTYSDKLIDGSPQNSVTAVPVDRATAIPLRK